MPAGGAAARGAGPDVAFNPRLAIGRSSGARRSRRVAGPVPRPVRVPRGVEAALADLCRDGDRGNGDLLVRLGLKAITPQPWTRAALRLRSRGRHDAIEETRRPP